MSRTDGRIKLKSDRPRARPGSRTASRQLEAAGRRALVVRADVSRVVDSSAITCRHILNLIHFILYDADINRRMEELQRALIKPRPFHFVVRAVEDHFKEPLKSQP